jgi:hypothetical protein
MPVLVRFSTSWACWQPRSCLPTSHLYRSPPVRLAALAWRLWWPRSSEATSLGKWVVRAGGGPLNWLRTKFSTGTYLHNSLINPWPESASKLYPSSGRRLSAKLVPTFADRGCHVVSATEPYGRILGFLDRSSYFLFHIAPQLYPRGWVDLVPDQLLLRKSGSAGNGTRTSGLVARNTKT